MYLGIELLGYRVWVLALVDTAKPFSKVAALTYPPIRSCFEGKIGLTSPYFPSLLDICLGDSPMPSIKSLTYFA